MTMSCIRKSEVSDLQALVRLHQKAFPGFFLTQLGPAFLCELYQGYLHSSDGICLVAETHGNMTGSLLGTVSPGGFYRTLFRRRWWAFLVAAVPGLLRKPVPVFRKLWEAMFYKGDPPSSHHKEVALIASVGVHPDYQGTGIGTSLLQAFFEEARHRGACWVYLTTDQEENEEGNAFYLKLGFQLEATFQKPGDRWMNRYLKPLAS